MSQHRSENIPQTVTGIPKLFNKKETLISATAVGETFFAIIMINSAGLSKVISRQPNVISGLRPLGLTANT